MKIPSKHYLMGWAAGYTLSNVQGNPDFYIEEPKYHSRIKGMDFGGYTSRETKVFKTKELAIKAAKASRREGGAPWFVHGCSYSTSNPEDAKGMIEWEDGMGEKIILD